MIYGNLKWFVPPLTKSRISNSEIGMQPIEFTYPQIGYQRALPFAEVWLGLPRSHSSLNRGLEKEDAISSLQAARAARRVTTRKFLALCTGRIGNDLGYRHGQQQRGCTGRN